jgi:hypothetical protein
MVQEDRIQDTGHSAKTEGPTDLTKIGAQKNKTEFPKKFGFQGFEFWSGREDLNLRPLGPEPSALPG